MNDIMDLHTHTIMSGHAYNTLYEMVQAAAANGVKLFGSTDHGPKIDGACNPMYFINFSVIPRTLFGVRLLMGCELNITDYEGTIDLKERFLKRIDFGIASIHVPCYNNGTISQNTSAYLGALKNPYVQIIGHPDDGRFPVDYDTLVSAAKEHHKLLEVNNSSLRPNTSRVGARENYLQMLELCRHYGTSILINSDAHCSIDAGNHTQAWELLKEIDFPEDLIVNTSIERITEFLPVLQTDLNGEG